MTPSLPLIWFLVGVAFLIAEFVLPGFILIFFAAGCWVAALSVLIFDIPLTGQIAVFIVASLIFLFSLRKYSLTVFKGSTRDGTDAYDSDAKIGKKGVVTKAITAGSYGEIKVMGSFWRATAESAIEEGRSVVITGNDADDRLTFIVKEL